MKGLAIINKDFMSVKGKAKFYYYCPFCDEGFRNDNKEMFKRHLRIRHKKECEE